MTIQDMSDIMDRTARSILREKKKAIDVNVEEEVEKDIISVLRT